MAKVTIAQVHGSCIAGGCELAMRADLVIAADDAVFGHPGTRGLGLWPSPRPPGGPGLKAALEGRDAPYRDDRAGRQA